jgi:hypothetical protein
MRPSNLRAVIGAVAAVAAVSSVAVPTGVANAAATIIINNLNGPGVGFNDPTPAAPVGGNTGTTLGEQRLIAFTYAANIWGATLTSSVPIVVNAQFTALSCNETGAVLGSAGATRVYSDWPGVPKPGTWYSYALANKLFGAEIDSGDPGPQINSRFNVNIGTPGCLSASGWYYGLDSNEPSNRIDFVAVLQHEMAHGLGFQTFTSGLTGDFFAGQPSIWDHYLLDATNNVLWKDATNAQRVASALSLDKLVWTGANVNTGAISTLRIGVPGVGISGPASGPLNGATLQAGEASFGAALTAVGVAADVMPVVTPTAGGPACGPLTANDARAVKGRIALIDRGVCGFVVKVKNAQNAGAIGVLIADNVAGSPPPGLGGTDPTIVIPAVRVTKADGDALKVQLRTRSRTASGVVARLARFGAALVGADALGRVKLFAPNPFQSGSSVSHFDTTATPNQLMEPSINGDLTQAVSPPLDLTLPLFQDIGW